MAASADAPLISRVRAGEVEAFAGLVSRYKGLVYTTVVRILGDREAASDVMQEAFLKAYAGLSSLKDAAAFKAWLLRIATNEAFRLLKEKRPELLEEESPAAEPVWAAGAEPLDELISRRVTAERVERAMEKLPAIYRAALHLRFKEHLAYKEISEALGVTLANVKFRIHHGTRLLRGLLGSEEW